MLSPVNWVLFQHQLKMRMLDKGDRQEMEKKILQAEFATPAVQTKHIAAPLHTDLKFSENMCYKTHMRQE